LTDKDSIFNFRHIPVIEFLSPHGTHFTVDFYDFVGNHYLRVPAGFGSAGKFKQCIKPDEFALDENLLTHF